MFQFIAVPLVWFFLLMWWLFSATASALSALAALFRQLARRERRR